MPEKIADRNIVILPPEKVMEAAIAKSVEISKQHKTNFVLNKKDQWPHLTLHQFAIPERNLGKMKAIVREAAKARKPFTVRLMGLSVFGGGGLFWDAEKTEVLWQLHKELVTKIVPLQEEYIMKQHAPFITGEADVDILKRRSMHRYGHPLANTESMDPPFWPHITITSCKTKQEAEQLAAQFSMPPMEFEAATLHIAGVGPSGTCPGSLEEIALG